MESGCTVPHLLPEGQYPKGSLVVLGELDAEGLEECLDVNNMSSSDVDVKKYLHHPGNICLTLDAELGYKHHQHSVGLGRTHRLDSQWLQSPRSLGPQLLRFNQQHTGKRETNQLDHHLLA